MKKAADKKANQTTPDQASQIKAPPKFRLIKNENWQPLKKPKLRIKLIKDDLPPAA